MSTTAITERCMTACCYDAQEGSKKGNLGGYVIAQAQSRFASAFGLEMKAVELHSAAKAAVGRVPKNVAAGALISGCISLLVVAAYVCACSALWQLAAMIST